MTYPATPPAKYINANFANSKAAQSDRPPQITPFRYSYVETQPNIYSAEIAPLQVGIQKGPDMPPMTDPSTIALGFAPEDAIIVTGAASGIGRATAVFAASLGLHVSAWDRDDEGLAQLQAGVGRQHFAARLHTQLADVSDSASRRSALNETAATVGIPRYLVNNAGPSSHIALEFDDAVRISVGSVRGLTTEWLEAGPPANAATVVTSSVVGTRIGAENDWYAASKAAVLGYVRHLAVHHGQRLRANAIAPGMTDTPRMSGFIGSDAGARVIRRVPLGRMGHPAEMAWTILFLLSPLASYINGQLLTVDGGWTVNQ
ncbi:SDR family NAD(P)-dependent oxidoreductase [Gordonia sp. NPDC127522]|uniref:SDR family NAD(P)-dependent oxidoreductase n=1 Tax=Gordonia sp. NPDC127522 TaxID=3345390 RepID=UPI0036458348